MLLKDVFTQFKDRQFIFVEPGGNFGDDLIYVGAKKLANELDIKYNSFFFDGEISPKSFWNAVNLEVYLAQSDIIYVHGGGGFNSIYGWAPQLLRILRSMFPKNLIIVGPTSTTLEPRYLSHILPKDKNIIFFAREMVTYNFIKRFYPKVYVDHDATFQLTENCDEFKSFCMGLTKKSEHSLLVLRQDAEEVPLPKVIKKENYDVVCDPATYEKEEWLKLHLWSSTITSNRLHSAIFGTIAGKEVKLFANSYHKNRAVWEFSLHKLGVEWIPHEFGSRMRIALTAARQKTFPYVDGLQSHLPSSLNRLRAKLRSTL